MFSVIVENVKTSKGVLVEGDTVRTSGVYTSIHIRTSVIEAYDCM